ncbi:hypothetical protein [Streptomyces sp. SID13031]|uniref:hypothetical protein n=1 Tax=Streptomyces sp. SID13031 TaxID=2706046 RepID=UPI0013CA99DE|nr:hypothetical protein [Streptomyces sp. SID13031]NEA32816.1 hypothetical protein [Streptomyces sp. SID13031]
MSTPTRTLNLAGGPAMEEPGPHSRAVDADHHLGLQDARCHDQDSIDPSQPLRRELTLAFGVMIHLQALLNTLLGTLMIQYDICKDLRAVQAGASEQIQQARQAWTQAGATLGTALAQLAPDRPDLVADAQEEAVAPEWSLEAFLRGWLAMTVFAILEIVTNYLAMQYLRDNEAATWVLAGATTAAILGGCYYIAQSRSRLRTSTLGICVAAVVVGSGVLRFRYVVDAVNQGLTESQLPNLDWVTKLAILAFAIGLPAAFGLITIAKTRPEPGAAEAIADQAAEERQVGGVRRLQATAERRKAELRAAVEAEAAAADALRNGETSLRMLCDQTDAAVMAEYGRRLERLDAYFRGLTLASGDPAMTTRLDRRYANAVGVLTEQLSYAIQEARKQISTVRAELLAFPAGESLPRERTEAS